MGIFDTYGRPTKIQILNVENPSITAIVSYKATYSDGVTDTIEKDEFFLRAKRIEIPASITAVEFYRKMGYDYKNGIAELDDEQVYRLEKFR